ncbi:MAG: methyltransferase domain-containing protein [Mariprofundus sp.]|nr:methyltransferase domain-containing protein [Mariprofundus sp.]
MEFKDSRITLGRSLSDYTKVQFFYSYFIRNSRAQIKSLPLKDYLNIGCGPNIDEQFINVDYQWRPGIHICWDLCNGLPPLQSNSFKGVYTEHCLEHIDFESCKKVIHDAFRILKPEGIF